MNDEQTSFNLSTPIISYSIVGHPEIKVKRVFNTETKKMTLGFDFYGKSEKPNKCKK